MRREEIVFSYEKSCDIVVAYDEAVRHGKDLEKERARLLQLFEENKIGCTEYASLAVPFDVDSRIKVQELVLQKRELQPTVVVVIGIGGSSLGAKAVHQAVFGRLRAHQQEATPALYFAETVDADRMAVILSVLERELMAGYAVLINVVTKSGTTTETLANFYVMIELLKQYRPLSYQELVIVTTDAESPLWQLGKSEGFSMLEIPKMVGGRYSVFSPVGLFPLSITGVNVDELCAGACAMVIRCLQQEFPTNPALMSALLHWSQYQQGITITDLFLFSVDLEAVGKWYRQLLAESIGKEFDKDGRQVLMGITPTVSLGSIDLHSVAQLSLGGPRDKFTTFVTVGKNKQTIVVPQSALTLAGRSFSEIMHALSEGTKEAYVKSKRPFCAVVLPEKNEFYVGQFLQFKMLEVMYLGFLCNVDPFDQPNVELYKQEACKLLRVYPKHHTILKMHSTQAK